MKSGEKMSLVKGKFAEVLVFRHLLGKGYQVYIPIVDTGVDFVVEPPKSRQHKFIGIQVKTSSYQPKSGWWLWSVYRDERRKSSPFFYVLCLEDIDELPEQIRAKSEDGLLCFVVPYKEMDKRLKERSDAWIKKGEYSLSINKKSFKTKQSKWLQFLRPYLNNWDILE